MVYNCFCPVCKKNFNFDSLEKFSSHINSHVTEEKDKEYKIRQEKMNELSKEIKEAIAKVEKLCDEYNKISENSKFNFSWNFVEVENKTNSKNNEKNKEVIKINTPNLNPWSDWFDQFNKHFNLY